MAHQYSCDACSFQVRSDDDDELVHHVQEHATDAHDMDVSPADVRDGMQETHAQN